MKIKYYGTGSAGGVPELFCNCRICRNAREVGGKEIRTRSQAVIDDLISIDFSVDAFLHNIRDGLSMIDIHDIVITHGHYDHFLTQELFGRPQGYESPLNIYATVPSAKSLLEAIERTERAYESGKRIRTSNFKLIYHPVVTYEPFDVKGYRFTPLKARHARNVDSVIYIIEKDGKSVLWAHDTGIFYEETFDYIRNTGLCFDFISIDCTMERNNAVTSSHMELEGVLEVINCLRKMKRVDDHTVIYLSHLGHLVNKTHIEAEAEAEPFGLKVAYDGLSVNF